MDQNAWIAILIGVAVVNGLFALGIALYPKLKNERQGYPFEAALEAALLPIIFHGICAGYRLSELGVDEINQRLTGADKKKIADSIYQMLPDKVDGYDLTLVKRIVSQERFEQLAQDGFDRFNRFYVEHRAHFDDLFAKWKQENAPALTNANAETPVAPPSPSALVIRVPNEPRVVQNFSQVRAHTDT